MVIQHECDDGLHLGVLAIEKPKSLQLNKRNDYNVYEHGVKRHKQNILTTHNHECINKWPNTDLIVY